MESPRKGTRWANQIDKPDYLIELDIVPRACVYGVFSTYGHETVYTGNTRFNNSNNKFILLWLLSPRLLRSSHHTSVRCSQSLALSPSLPFEPNTNGALNNNARSTPSSLPKYHEHIPLLLLLLVLRRR